MEIGAVQTVVICASSTKATTAQQVVCPPAGRNFFVPQQVQAYLLAPGQKENIEAAVGPFDYAYAGGLWAMAFSMVVGLYCVSSGVGTVLGMIRRN